MHKICALTTCEINYAPDNVYQSYEDTVAGSQPIRSTMTLNFTELTPIFESDYRESVADAGFDPATEDLFGQRTDGSDPFQPISIEDTGF